MASLSYQLDLDPAETVRAGRAVGRRTLYGKTSPFVWGLIAAAPLVVGAVAGAPLEAFRTYLSVLAVVGLAVLSLPAIQRWQYRRAYAQTPSLRLPQVYRFTDDSLEMVNDLARAEMRWDALVEAAETGEFFLFYYSKKCAYFLPKRVVGAEDAQAELREFVRARVNDRATGLQQSGGNAHPT